MVSFGDAVYKLDDGPNENVNIIRLQTKGNLVFGGIFLFMGSNKNILIVLCFVVNSKPRK